MLRAGAKGKRELLSRVTEFVLQDKVLDLLHNNVHMVNATELYTLKWLRW